MPNIKLHEIGVGWIQETMAQIFTTAVLNYIKSYPSGTDWESSWIFHVRVPHNILHHKLGLTFYTNIKSLQFSQMNYFRRTENQYDERNHEKCHVFLLQKQEVLWWIGKIFPFGWKRFLFYNSAKSTPPRVRKTIPWP